MTYKNKLTGFTIVELLIVIVVIGILAAISIVAFSGVRQRANESAAVAELSSLTKQFDMFRVTEGYYPSRTVNNGADMRISCRYCNLLVYTRQLDSNRTVRLRNDLLFVPLTEIPKGL